jgi:hypothetical protein
MAAVTLVCVLALLYGYHSLLAAPLRQRTVMLQRQAGELEAALAFCPAAGDAQARKRRLAALREAIQRQRQVLDAGRERMASEGDISRLVKDLAMTAEPERFELVALRRRPLVHHEIYAVQPFVVVFRADYGAVIDYLGCFSGGDKWYVIDRLRIRSLPEILPRVEVEVEIHNVIMDVAPRPAGGRKT